MKCLLLIDLQNEFLAHSGNFQIAPTSRRTLVHNTAKLVRSFRARQEVLVWIRSEYTVGKLKADNTEFLDGTHTGKTPCCVQGSSGADFPNWVKELQQPQDLVITKTWYSAFKETDLRQNLEARGVTELYVGGLLSNVCVRATAEAALSFGLDITVLEDCLGWRKHRSHDAAVGCMRKSGVRIATRYEAFGKLHPQEPVLYFVNGSIPSWRVFMALYEKGVEFSGIRLKVMSDPKETQTPAFLALNHRGKTPVLVDPQEGGDDIVINESLAILQYLDTFHGQDSEKPLLPPVSDRHARAKVLARVQESENLHNIYDALEDAYFEAENQGQLLQDDERAKLIAAVQKELKYWEAYASEALYIAGDTFSLADCAFFPLLGYMVHRGFEWPAELSNLRAYFERVWERDGEEGAAKRAQPVGWDQPGRTNVWKSK